MYKLLKRSRKVHQNVDICCRVTVLQPSVQKYPHAFECLDLPVPAACTCDVFGTILPAGSTSRCSKCYLMFKSFVATFTLIPCPTRLNFNSNTLDSYNVAQSVKILFSLVFDIVKNRNKENQVGKDGELI